MSDLNTEIKIGADASGVEAGVGKAKRSLADLGASAKKAGQDAAGGMAGIGSGADLSAKKVESATRNMVGSLQRQIAAMEAGDKTSRKYQETLARMRGVDVNALKPYLDQLDSLKGKASLAERAQASLNSVMFKATAVLAVTAGITAYARSVVNGIDALNDLKDATGASIENISALEDVALRAGGSFDVVGTSLLKFNAVLKDAKPGSNAEAALKAIGLSAEELKRLDPAEALLKTATALQGFADDGNKGRITLELFGKALKDIAPFLNDLAEKGKLVGTVTAEQSAQAERFNKELSAMQKNVTDISRDFTGPLVSSINEVIKKFREGAAAGEGFFAIAKRRYVDNVRDVYGLGPSLDPQRQGIQSLESEIKSLREQQSAITLDIFGQKGSIQKDIDAKIAALSAAKAAYFKLTSGAGGGRGSVNPALVDVRASVGDIPDSAKPRKPTRDPAADAATREIAEQAKLLAELSGLTASFSTDWERLNTIYAKGQLSLEGLTDAQAKLLDKQPFAVALAREESEAVKALTKAREEDAKAYEDTINGRLNAAASVGAQVTQEREAIAAMGLSRNAVAELEAAKLSETAASKLRLAAIADEIDWSGRLGATYRDEAAQLQALASLKRESAAKQTGIDAAKESADAWQKTADSIESGLTDALMRGFENGKSFGENLGDSLSNYFKTVVAREIATAITRAIMSAMASTQWGQLLSGLLGGGTGGGTDWLSMATKAYDAYTKGTSAAAASSGAGSGGAAAAAASAYGATPTAGGAGSLGGAAAGAVGTTSTAGTAGAASSASTSLMTYAGYAALIVAAIKIAENLYSTGYNRTALGVQSSKVGANNSLGQYSYGRGNTTTGNGGSSSGIYNVSGENLNRELFDAIGMNEKWADIFSGTVRMATLFGRKLKGYGYQANISGADVDVKGYEYYKGGLFRSNKTVTQDVNKQDADELRAGIESVRDSSKAMAQAMGYSTEAIDNYTGSLKINLKGVKNGEEAAQRYGEAMEKLQRQMLNNIPGLKMNEEQFKEFIEGITKSMQDVGISVGGIADIITQGMLGRISQAQVGEQLSDVVIGGIYSAIAGQYAQQIASVFTQQIIQPIFIAIAAGVPISQAISQAAISNVVSTAQRAAAALNAIFADPGFRGAIAGIQQAISGISIASGSVKAPKYKAAVSSYNAAAEAAKRAAEEAQRAAEETRRAWQSVADSLSDEIRRIKGELLGDTSQGQSYYMAQFQAATSSARAGDQAAANMLPELSQAVLDIARSTSASLADLQFLQSTTIASLSETRRVLSERYGLTIPKFAVGTNYVPQDMIAQIHKGEAIVPAAYNPAAGGMANNGAGLLAQAQALREMAAAMDRLAASSSEIATNTRETRKTLDRVSQGGEALLTVAAS